MSEQSTFGSWLKNRRKFMDLTQDELARRVGCSLMLIQKIEADERRPSKQLAELLAAHFGVPPDERADFVRFAREKRTLISSDANPPWRALRQHLTNLPVPPTPLFGREQDTAEIVRRIAEAPVRLLTLVGPPGIGKTRLALAGAAELLDCFDDGVYFVPLAPVRDPDHVAPTIARALGVKEIAGRSWPAVLTQHLACRRVLVLLDNFEQVVSAAPFVAELLAACPYLHILVTSRVSLHVRAERQFRVAPLALSSAVELFLDRVRAVEPNYAPSPEDISALAQICARLDSLPLAVELVASHALALSPQALLAQIDRRLALVSEGPRDLPARHQTLYAAIAWSYELLDAAAQALFACLSIFVDGWTTEMVLAICGEDVSSALAALADASLIVHESGVGGPARWSMLETIREYAAERLALAGQTDEVARRHAEFFLVFAESAGPHLSGPQQVEWLDRLERDHGNLHAALEWAVGRGEADTALRLGAALFLFWYKQGRIDEASAYLQRALALDTRAIAPTVRQSALNAAGVLAWGRSDFAQAQTLAEQAYTLACELGDRKKMANALHVLANIATDTSDYARGIALHEQTLALRRDLGDKAGMASSLINLGRIAYYLGDAAQAIRNYEASLAVQRELGDHFSIALVLNNLGGALADNLQELDRAASLLQESAALSRERETNYFLLPFTLTQLGRVALYTNDLERAHAVLEEALSVAHKYQSRSGITFALLHLAQLALTRNDGVQAAAFLREGLELQRTGDDKSTALRYLATAAALHCAQQEWVRAATLIGAIAGTCENAGIQLPPVYQKQHGASITLTRERLAEPIFTQAWAEGRRLTLEQAVELAI